MHKQYDGDIYNAPAMQAALGIYSRHGCAESPPEILAGGCGLSDQTESRGRLPAAEARLPSVSLLRAEKNDAKHDLTGALRSGQTPELRSLPLIVQKQRESLTLWLKKSIIVAKLGLYAIGYA